MYFKDKEDTNIDKEFKEKKWFNVSMPIVLLCALFVVGILLFIVGSIIDKRNNTVIMNNIGYYMELVGDKEITLYMGEEYNDPGCKGYDIDNNDVTDKILVSDNINVNEIGEYSVKYTLYDIELERIVKVVEKPMGATLIHLKGDLVVYLNVGSTYNEPGYEVVDTVDGGLKDKVNIDSNVDTSRIGSYHIIYSVVNSSGITTTKKRTVIVMDSDVSITTDNDNYTNGEVGINIYVSDLYFDYMVLPNNEKVSENRYTYRVSENGTYKFLIYNKKGGSKEASINVNNINKNAPSGSCSGSFANGVSTINVSANDDIGIGKYIVNGNSYTSSPIKINGELKSVTVSIYDKAGNVTNVSCDLEDKNSSSSQATDTTKGNIANVSSSTPVARFGFKDIHVNYYKASNGQQFTFWSYVPLNASKGLPVVLYLVDNGARGDDYHNSGSIAGEVYGPIELAAKRYRCNAIYIHVQHPSGSRSQDYIWAYKELLDKVIKEFDADKNNVSIIGFSNGCYGANNMVVANPGYFSAAILMGCTPGINSASAYVKTPVWAFCGSGDGCRSNELPAFVNQVKKLGGKAWYTSTGTSHNVFEDGIEKNPLERYGALKWIINPNNTSKIASCWYPKF